jgi:Flp pilus assembly protein TadD
MMTTAPRAESPRAQVALRFCAAAVLASILLACGGGQTQTNEPDDVAILEEKDEGAAPSSSQVAEGKSAIDAGDFEKAAAVLTKATADSPEDPQAFFYLGVAHEQLGHADEAVTAYQKAAELDPKLIDASVNLSALLTDLQRDQEALDVVEKALKLVPEDKPLKANRALILLNMGKPEAAEAYAELVKAEPGNQDFKFNHGAALLVAGKDAEAKAVLDSIQTDDLKLLGDIGSLYLKMQAPDACIKMWDGALSRNESAEGLVHRARCKFTKKDIPGAKKDLTAALAKDSTSSMANFYMGAVLEKSGKAAEAKKHFQAAAEKDDEFGAAAKKQLGQ